MHAEVSPANHPVVARLQALLGREHVVLDAADREFYSTDIYNADKTALVVVRPGSTADVAQIVQLAREHDLPLVPRGGGASYTDGYVPAEENSILLDTSRLNQIVEINERDMYVIVQAGVTWAALHDALLAKGLRTPFYGPFSGIAAT
ncbi:MAG TPA: FAD-binding oxidoreductase, partial [Steroidobacteraceae bacterium]|nr:FAD-binding oxidoreductase [Steroidobacteraceae bacterium]